MRTILFSFSLLFATVSARALTHSYDMEHPIDWSDISMEWGAGGIIDFCYEEPGHPGKALHLTTVPIPDASECANLERGQEVANEGRAIQWNHKPGTRATISFDFKVFTAPEEGCPTWFRVMYYDGYVTAEFFQANAGDPFYKVPEPLLHWTPGMDRDWQHVEVTTDTLNSPVLTLWIQGAKACAGGYLDAAIDNLSVEVEPAVELRDSGFDWNGVDTDKMIHCRRGLRCRDLPWCDLMYDETAPASPQDPRPIWYGNMMNFRGTSGNFGMLNMKHDFNHHTSDPKAAGLSVMNFASIHGGGAAKSMGVRQTVSYEAWGLKPGQPGRVIVQTKGASVFPEDPDGVSARTLLGVDPNGGTLGAHPRVLWSEEGLAPVSGTWHIHRIEFARPPDAEALTVFLKWRDGHPDSDCDGKAHNGNDGFFDWVLVEVQPE